MKPKAYVLVSGSGVAGPVTAYWLTRAGCKVTLVERAPTLRHNGQGVDIRGAGVEIVRRMGVEEEIREQITKEEGLVFVNEDNVIEAKFPVTDADKGGGISFTSDIEILRGNLTRIFWEATKDRVDYVFDTAITEFEEDATGVFVKLSHEDHQRRYDLVVAADGLFSRPRALMMKSLTSRDAPIASLDGFCCTFTLSRTKEDTGFSRWFNVPGRRSILIRPVTPDTSSAYMTVIVPGAERAAMRVLIRSTADRQRAFFRENFANAGWEGPRMLAAMDKAGDFYFQELAQVKMETWVSPLGRGVCVGDAAHCPSPLTGMGTTVAIVGPYVLAGEVARQIRVAESAGREAARPVDMKKACDDWEAIMRPWVLRAQKIPPGVPWIANPETKWGIWLLCKIVGFAAWSGLADKFGGSLDPPAKFEQMPEYDFASRERSPGEF